MRILLRALLALTLLSPSIAYSQETTPTQALDRLVGQFVQSFNAHDLKTVASLYAEDALWMPPNAPIISGRAAIEAAIISRYTGFPGVLKMTRVSSDASASLGVYAATYTVTVPMAGGGSQIIAAKSLTVFKRLGSGWKVAYDMQNADQSTPSR